jgi:hypothetical protein
MKGSKMLVGGISLLNESPIARKLRETKESSRKEQEEIKNAREAHKDVLDELIEMSPEDRFSESGLDGDDELMFRLEENEYQDRESPSSSVVVESKAREILRAIRERN